MAANEVHLGDIGTVFRLTVKDGTTVVNVSTADQPGEKEVIFTKPDGTKLTKAAAFTTNGSDGQIQYTTIAGDLDQAGLWQNQGHVKLDSGEWWTDTATFRVHANL